MTVIVLDATLGTQAILALEGTERTGDLAAGKELKFIGFFTSIHWEDFTSCWECDAYHFLIISGQTMIFSYTEPRSCLA